MPQQLEIASLLAAPPSPENARALFDWATAIPGRIARGDMIIGILTVDDIAQVPVALSRAADGGIDQALLKLAFWFANPAFGDPDLPTAERELLDAIRRGIPGADLGLAQLRWFYQRDECGPEQRAQAYQLVEDRVRRHPDDARALYLLGLLTCAGFGTSADPTRALDLQRRSADLGDPAAMFEIYAQYANGIGAPRDDAAAFAALTRAADAGHPRALYNMGAYHATGRGIPKDLTKAVAWYERAADAGQAGAIATLAIMYARGEGVPRDPERAAELFDQAEYLGLDVSAARRLISC
jgi:hypothetical protein